MSDLFAAAKTVETETPTPAKGKGKARLEVDMGRKLTRFAAATSLMKSLETWCEGMKAEIKEEASGLFIKLGTDLGVRPENFRSIDRNDEGEIIAQASTEFRKRSTRSVLKDDECEFLAENNIPFDEVVDKEIPEVFFLNQEILDDPTMRDAVSNALSQLPELKGLKEGIIQRQAPVKKTHREVTDESVNTFFAKLKAGEIEETAVDQIFDTISVIGLKPVLKDEAQMREVLVEAGFIKTTEQPGTRSGRRSKASGR